MLKPEEGLQPAAELFGATKADAALRAFSQAILAFGGLGTDLVDVAGIDLPEDHDGRLGRGGAGQRRADRGDCGRDAGMLHSSCLQICAASPVPALWTGSGCAC